MAHATNVSNTRTRAMDVDENSTARCDFTEHEDELAAMLPQAGVEAQRMLDRTAVQQTLARRCCKKHCLGNFDVEEVLKFREPFAAMTRKERRIYHANNPSLQEHAGNTYVRSEVFLHGDAQRRAICISAYRELMGITKGETWMKILANARSRVPALHEVRISVASLHVITRCRNTGNRRSVRRQRQQN